MRRSEYGNGVPIGDRFRAGWAAAWAQARLSRGAVGGVPELAAEVCRRVLAVDGVSFGLRSGDFRVPLGASGTFAAEAEQLQFTLSEGPCLEGMLRNIPIHASQAQLEQRWPTYYRELATRTPFRSVLSVPLWSRRGPQGALDAYMTAPALDAAPTLADLAEVARELAGVLTRHIGPFPHAVDADLTADWLQSRPARSRTQVWMAMGYLRGSGGLGTADALAALRAYSFLHNRDLDEVAADLLAGEVPVDAVIDRP